MTIAIRLVSVVAGLLLIFVEFDTFMEVIQFYSHPGAMPLRLKLLNTKQSKLFSVLVLDFAAASLLLAVLPTTKATSNLDLPKNLLGLIEIVASAALLEEFTFRIAPWAVLFILRKLAKRNIWVERASIVIAILISVIFGLLHATNYSNPDIATYLSCLIQTSAGLLLWYLLEKDGLAASIVVHMLFNLIVMLPSML